MQRFFSPRRWMLPLLVWGVALGGAGAVAAVQSVEEFNAKSGEWAEWAAKKTPVTIEGRYSSISRIALKMRNCELLFKPAPSAEIPKVAASAARIEVAGHLTMENGKPIFQIERIRELRSELEEIRQRSRAARKENAADRYDIAVWAAGRGAFYNDSELIQEAERLRLEGIGIERQQIPKEKPESLLPLAKKVAELKLTESLREELVHEAYQRLWDAERKATTPEFAALGERMKEELPGADLPLQPPQPKLEQRYHAQPLETYREATADERRKLHRILYSDLTLARIVFTLKPDGSNGIAVAEEIQTQIPEHSAKAEPFIEQELAHRFKNLAKATRQEALALSELYRKRNDARQARATLNHWLAAREPLLRKDGPDGLKRLAEEHLNLLEDEARASELLKEAWKLSPNSEEIAERLEKLGFRLKDGQWLTLREFKSLPQDPIAQAMARGDVIVGMTQSQVRKTLGEPNAIGRFVTADGVAEVWSYGGRDASRLSIQLVRKSLRGGEAKVIQVQRARAN